MKNLPLGLTVLALALVLGLVCYVLTHTNIRAGHVGYVYDRTLKPTDSRVIPGTSVINEQRTGRIRINPWTQEILKYPTTIVAKSWTRPSEGDNNGEDWSVTVASIEGKDVTADVYISVRPSNIGMIIGSFGNKSFDSIVSDDIYGLARGKLAIVTQRYSVYDTQAKKSEIQEEAKALLEKDLSDIYGIELVHYEIGTLTPPGDIQTKIDQKTEAINAVELAKLDRQKQDEVNQKIVDQQKAESEKEKLKRANEADAQSYEITKKAEADKLAAELKLETAKLEKQAEQEKQQTYTDEYLKNKELDLKYAALNKINESLRIVVDSGDGGGLSSIPVIKEILAAME